MNIYTNKFPLLKQCTPSPNFVNNESVNDAMKTVELIPAGTVFEVLLHDGCYIQMTSREGLFNVMPCDLKVLFSEVEV